MSLSFYFCLDDNQINDEAFINASKQEWKRHKPTLSDREKEIFALRYGLSESLKPETLEKIALKFKLSRERIRQILKKICRKIRFRTNKEEKGTIPKTDYLSLRSELFDKINSIYNEQYKYDMLVDLCDEYLPNVYYPSALELIYAFAFENNESVDLFGISLSDFKGHLLKERRIINAEEKLKKLFHKFLSVKNDDKSCIKLLSKNPSRNVNKTEFSGTFYSSKLSRDVMFESNLEKAFLLNLENCSFIESYTEQPFAITYLDACNSQRRYFPDVLVKLCNGFQVIVEIKPIVHMAHYNNLLKMEALRKFCSQNGLGYLLTEGTYNRSIDIMMKRPLQKESWENELMEYINDNGFIKWRDFKGKFKSRFKISYEDFVPFIIKKSLKFTTKPFLIEKIN